MSELIPPDQALRLYLAMIAGGARSGYFEIRSKRVGGPGMFQDFVPLQEFDRAMRSVVNRGRMSDTYVGMAPRLRPAGGLDAIEDVWALWADCDSAESVRQLAAFRPLPSIVIRSGSDGHRHAYWPLRSPVSPKEARRANLRLALRLSADRNACDGARIMRPPLTSNFKTGEPRPVVCSRLELDVFDAGQVVRGLPDAPGQAPSRPRPQAIAADPSRALEGLVRTVREAPVGNRNQATFWCFCKALEGGRNEAAIEAIRSAAIERGLPEREVDRTLESARSQTGSEAAA